MDAKIKAQWVAALRSGNYPQGTGRLRRIGTWQDGYCCLGVLCDLVDPAAWIREFHDCMDAMPSENVLTAANLRQKAAGDLARLNDAGKSFDEIADYIEANL